MISAAVRSGTVGSSPARLRTARTSRAARVRCSCPEVPFGSQREHMFASSRGVSDPSTIPRVNISRPRQRFQALACGDCLTSGTVESPARVGLPPAVAARESGRLTASLQYFAGAGQGNQSRNRVVFRRNEDEPIAVLSVPHAGLQENLEAGGVKEGEVG